MAILSATIEVSEEVGFEFCYTAEGGWRSTDRMEPDEPPEIDIFGPYYLMLNETAHKIDAEVGEAMVDALYDDIVEEAWDDIERRNEKSDLDMAEI